MSSNFPFKMILILLRYICSLQVTTKYFPPKLPSFKCYWPTLKFRQRGGLKQGLGLFHFPFSSRGGQHRSTFQCNHFHWKHPPGSYFRKKLATSVSCMRINNRQQTIKKTLKYKTPKSQGHVQIYNIYDKFGYSCTGTCSITI